MLIIEKIKIKLNNKNIKHFAKLGYDNKYGEIIEVNCNELSENSKFRVNIICDRCGEIKNITYQEYLNQRKKFDFDTCNKCKFEKNKIINLEKFGVEYYMATDEFKEKSKITNFKKYGNENYNNIEKTKKTNLIKYGTEYSFLNDEVRNKVKINKLEKYGNENYNNIEQTKKTNLEKYGYENPFQSEEIKEKIRNTNFKNLGVPYPTMSKNVTDKSLETNIKNGRWIKVEYRDAYYNYYLKVYSETLKNKKELLDNWNGYDYYSNEYILDNFKLDSNDKKYPTMDHKKSIRYGFDNNISSDEISNIENLCITTRSNNSSKSKKNESEFNIIQYDNKI